MGGGGNIDIPDYKQYKVEGIKQLEKLQRMLAARGLNDPWIRNEVWRYNPKFYTSKGRSALLSLGRGAIWAVPAVLLTVTIKKLMHKNEERDGGH